MKFLKTQRTTLSKLILYVLIYPTLLKMNKVFMSSFNCANAVFAVNLLNKINVLVNGKEREQSTLE